MRQQPPESWLKIILISSLLLASGKVHGVFAQSASSPQPATEQSSITWNFTKPLRVCTASIQDYGARCNGAVEGYFDEPPHPVGDAPPEGWCIGEDFCGYDVSVWREAANRVGLVEGVDYVHVCMGETGFDAMIADLAGTNATNGPLGTHRWCDVGVSAITASTEREALGITFSRATHRSSLAVMIFAPLSRNGMWAFFRPLHANVWLALVVTIIATPFFVFFFESLLSGRCIYTDKHGRLNLLYGLKESLWHSVSHTLSIDVFRVHAMPARIVTVAYAFLVLILTNTYTANLAAFLTVNQLSTSISSVEDLRGKAVATVPTYVRRLYDNHGVSATTIDDRDYDQMISKLRAGVYQAVISDDTQLIPRAWSDSTCSLHVLPETIEPFDLAFAYSTGWADRGLQYRTLALALDRALLELLESNVLVDLDELNKPPPPECLAATEFSETNQVDVASLWGLWVILAVAVALASAVAAVQYLIAHARGNRRQEQIAERAAFYRRTLTQSVPLVKQAAASLSFHAYAKKHADDRARDEEGHRVGIAGWTKVSRNVQPTGRGGGEGSQHARLERGEGGSVPRAVASSQDIEKALGSMTSACAAGGSGSLAPGLRSATMDSVLELVHVSRADSRTSQPSHSASDGGGGQLLPPPPPPPPPLLVAPGSGSSSGGQQPPLSNGEQGGAAAEDTGAGGASPWLAHSSESLRRVMESAARTGRGAPGSWGAPDAGDPPTRLAAVSELDAPEGGAAELPGPAPRATLAAELAGLSDLLRLVDARVTALLAAAGASQEGLLGDEAGGV